MCDTVAIFDRPGNLSYFGKNSDRNPKELQMLYISNNPEKELELHRYQEEKAKYINYSFKKLKESFNRFDNPYSAVISRPLWIWGAEMGVNQHGLAIGNEAVFSREEAGKDGLLGMDILRLALHNTKTAEEAANFIVELIQEYNQSGDGMYSGKLYYHNSYLIKDFNQCFILETAGNHWAKKESRTVAAISNTYTIGNNYDKIDNESNSGIDFKSVYENKFLSFFSKGSYRQQFSRDYLLNHSTDLKTVISLLRSHGNKQNKIRKGMKSICMHPGIFKTETTASMIVEYRGGKCIVWFTGAPHPCVSLYKPMILPGKKAKFKLSDFNYAVKYSEKRRKIVNNLIKNYKLFLRKIKPLRDKVEDRFMEIIHKELDSKSEEDLTRSCIKCYKIAEYYYNQILNII